MACHIHVVGCYCHVLSFRLANHIGSIARYFHVLRHDLVRGRNGNLILYYNYPYYRFRKSTMLGSHEEWRDWDPFEKKKIHLQKWNTPIRHTNFSACRQSQGFRTKQIFAFLSATDSSERSLLTHFKQRHQLFTQIFWTGMKNTSVFFRMFRGFTLKYEKKKIGDSCAGSWKIFY